jgi:hypothetical protein
MIAPTRSVYAKIVEAKFQVLMVEFVDVLKGRVIEIDPQKQFRGFFKGLLF